MSDLFHVSSSPHVRAKDSTDRIMLYVIIALLPASLLVFTILDLEHFLSFCLPSHRVWHQNGCLTT